MAAVSNREEINAERRKRVFIGTLPTDFLRIEATSQQQQEAADQQTALALQQQLVGPPIVQNPAGRLNITVAQAKLVKNYGMTRMDPYVRLRVGHCVYETHTDPNGGKNPRWNKVVQCLLPQGVNSLYVEIYDECSFTMDELIAWAHISIPPAVMAGETHEDWYPLNGKQGDGMEGVVNLVLSYSLAPMNPYGGMYGGMYGGGRGGSGSLGITPVMMVPSTATPMYGLQQVAPVAVYTHAPVPQQPPPQQLVLSEQDLKQIEEMFPNIDKEVVKTVFEVNRGNKDATVNSLLQMCE